MGSQCTYNSKQVGQDTAEQARLRQSGWITFMHRAQALCYILCKYTIKISTNMKMLNPLLVQCQVKLSSASIVKGAMSSSN